MRGQTCLLLCVLFGMALGAPFPATQCPLDCECITHQQNSQQLEARCTSLMFMDNLQPKELNAITRLDLSHLNLTKIGHSLKKLHALKSINLSHNNLRGFTELSNFAKLTYLNLRGNHIKYLTIADLPKSVQHLDLSNNYLVDVPEGLENSKSLRELNIADNPFACSCDIKKKCEAIIAAGIILVKPVTCRSYDSFQGPLLDVNRLNCTNTNTGTDNNDLDRMQGDQSEGSGEEEEEEELTEGEENNNFASADTVNKLNDIESEEFLPNVEIKGDAKTEYEDDDESEGSGDPNEEEGSGDEYVAVVPTEETPLKACNFDCTPLISTVDPNNSTEPDPNLFDEFSNAVQDIFYGSSEDKDKNVSKETEVTEEPIKEIIVAKSDTGRSSDVIGNVKFADEKEKIQEAVSVGESGEMKEGGLFGLSNNMLIVIALIIIMICVVVYSILVKRRKGRRRSPPVIEQEMKPLNVKPTNDSNDTNGRNIPEKVPLMNGQNGNMNGKPVDEPVIRKRNEELESRPRPSDDVDGKPDGDGNGNANTEPSYLRKKNRDDDKLLPEKHRVTVQAKELTTPKTPMLVNRLRSHDGEIITTPDPDQRL